MTPKNKTCSVKIPFGQSNILTFPSQQHLNSYIIAQIDANNLSTIHYVGNPYRLNNKKACNFYATKAQVSQVGHIWVKTLKQIDYPYIVIQKQK